MNNLQVEPTTCPRARSLTRLFVSILLLATAAFAQLTTFTVNSAPDTPRTSTNANWSDYTTTALPSSYMTGATVALHWIDVDTGTAAGGCPQLNFSTIDSTLSTLYSDAQTNNKFINFIVMPVTEGGNNNYTPAYVFTQLWANNLASGGCGSLSPPLGNIAPVWNAGSPYLPLDYIKVNGVYWQETGRPWSSTTPYSATCTTGGSEHAFLSGTSSYPDGNCTWTNKGANAPPQDACFSSFYHGNNVILNDNGGNSGCFNVNNLPFNAMHVQATLTDLETGFLVSYETPMKVAWKYFIQQVINHYQNNQSALHIKLGYIRFGLSEGGESVPLVGGSWPDFNNLAGKGPASGASIEYLSYISDMMVFQNNNNQQSGANPPINLLADLNTWNGKTDYPDQEALYAVNNNIGFGTNGLQVTDVTAINPPAACTSPNANISGDWCYNFAQHCSTAMPNGKFPICSLQTFLLSTPGGNPFPPPSTNPTGSLSDEYWNNGTTWVNFPGLIPTGRQYGANNLEIYTCDIIFTADPTYSSSNCATSGSGNPASAAFENDYQSAFTLFLNPLAPGITSPVPGSNTTSDTTLALVWNAFPGAASYKVQIGSTQGTQNYYHNTVTHLFANATFAGSATTGSDVWVRWTPNNTTAFVDYHYVAK